nr:MAG TPA: cp-chaperonin [Crassvirales sp.]
MDMYDDNLKVGSLIDTTRANTIKEYQTILAVGPMVKAKGDLKVGDVVFINPKRFTTMAHKHGLADEDNVQKDNMHINFNIPHYPVYDREDGGCREVLLISDNDIFFSAEGEEFDECPPVVTEDKPTLTL